jgi:transcriptional regulator with XRE-family HTH domain
MQGVRQAELAARVKTTQRRISLMESGDKSISIDKLVAANVALGMGLTDLLQRVSVSISASYIDHQPKRALTIRRVAKHREPAANR